jgi:hypothetical protein
MRIKTAASNETVVAPVVRLLAGLRMRLLGGSLELLCV